MSSNNNCQKHHHNNKCRFLKKSYQDREHTQQNPSVSAGQRPKITSEVVIENFRRRTQDAQEWYWRKGGYDCNPERRKSERGLAIYGEFPSQKALCCYGSDLCFCNQNTCICCAKETCARWCCRSCFVHILAFLVLIMVYTHIDRITRMRTRVYT